MAKAKAKPKAKPRSSSPAQCEATTQAGRRCKAKAIGKHGRKAFCSLHIAGAREKSSHGGVRKNAGRKQKNAQTYIDLFEELGEPPKDDPLALAVWAQDASARAMFLTATGSGNAEINKEIRGFALVIQKLIPLERVALVERLIKGRYSAKKPRASGGPEPSKDAVRSSDNRSPTRR